MTIIERTRRPLLLAALALGAIGLGAPSAHATQPLESFVSAAKKSGFDAREGQALHTQRKAEAEQAGRKLWPTLAVRGVYTRNQDEVAAQFPGSAERLVITPLNQLDAYFQLDVPLLDLPNYHRINAAEHQANAASSQLRVTAQDTERAVTRAYFQYQGATALVQAAELSIQAAVANLDNVAQRRSLGAATDLDYERASASVEQSRQDLADAQLTLALSGRALETLSGLTPEATDPSQVQEDDLHAELPIARWEQRAKTSPSLAVMADRTRALSSTKKVIDTMIYPTLTATAQERLTNATGFSGNISTYNLQLVAAWKLDLSAYSAADAQMAQAEQTQIQTERISRNISDGVFEAYQRVQSGIARCRSARAKLGAASRAAQLSVDRFSVGAATQLDVTLAQREAFLARAASIQANSDLAYARSALRLASGLSVTDRSSP